MINKMEEDKLMVIFALYFCGMMTFIVSVLAFFDNTQESKRIEILRGH